MENKKDNISAFGYHDSKNNAVFKLFEKDNYLLFLYRKMEKITSAFHLVSSLLSDQEPIKWSMRKESLAVLSAIISLTPGDVQNTEKLYVLNSSMIKLSSILDIAYVSGLVSEMNFKIVKIELERLINGLPLASSNDTVTVGKRISLTTDFFGIEPEKMSPEYSSDSQPPIDDIKSKHNEDRLIRSWTDVVKVQAELIKRQIKNGPEVKDSDVSETDANKGHESFIANRETLILETLKSRDRLTVKDFLGIIKGVSTKTIQRELLKLVSAGVLKKDGERRWSRYSLIKF